MVDDELVIESLKAGFIGDGKEDARKHGLEPTGETSAKVIENIFGSRDADGFRYRMHVVIRCLGPEEEVDEEELAQ